MKLIRFLLFPIAVIYDLVTRVRNFLFDVGFFKSTAFDIPVIVVGNLSVGGTGKTPQIEYLIRLLKDEFNVAVLSRGYKRKTKGFIQLTQKHTAEEVGDEPLQFAKKFPEVTVAVDVDRVNGINNLIKRVNPDVVLLDDAYQHRKVKAGFYVLLTKYSDLYTDDFLLPTGNLRESRKGAKRANCIIVTKCPNDISDEEQQKIVKKIHKEKHQQIFFTSIGYDDNLQGSQVLSIDDLVTKKVFLITGIANPNPLLKYLSSKNIDYKHLKYPDHHNFSETEIQKIKKLFNEESSVDKILLTTEKDYMRLKDKFDELSYISIQTVFLEGQEVFDTCIQSFIRK